MRDRCVCKPYGLIQARWARLVLIFGQKIVRGNHSVDSEIAVSRSRSDGAREPGLFLQSYRRTVIVHNKIQPTHENNNNTNNNNPDHMARRLTTDDD